MKTQVWLSQLSKSLFSVLLATLLTLTVPWLAMADTITVNTTADEFGAGANCSVREAIQAANTNTAFGGCTHNGTAGMDTINIPANSYTLSIAGADEDFNGTGDLDVLTDTAGILLNGTGATSATVVLDANGIDRVIQTANGVALHLNNLTIEGGSVSDSGGGAYFGGTAIVTGTTFFSNAATSFFPGGDGGGAYFGGTAIVMGTTFLSNTATGNMFGGGGGGGAYFANTASVTGTTFSDNSTGQSGGGAWFNSTASVTGATFSGNTATDGGGAYFNSTASVTGTTFSGNTAASEGGGAFFNGAFAMQFVNVLFARNWATTNGAAVYVFDASPLRLIHTTIVSPSTPTVDAAVYVNGGTVYLTNTIIASHTTGIQQAGGAVVEDYNLSKYTTKVGGKRAKQGHQSVDRKWWLSRCQSPAEREIWLVGHDSFCE